MHELNGCRGGCISRKNIVAAVVDCGLRKLIMAHAARTERISVTISDGLLTVVSNRATRPNENQMLDVLTRSSLLYLPSKASPLARQQREDSQKLRREFLRRCLAEDPDGNGPLSV
jgi:hypothetical protein